MEQHLTTDQGILYLKKYIKEMKGIDIDIIPPRNVYELNLFHHMAHHAYNYYHNG